MNLFDLDVLSTSKNFESTVALTKMQLTLAYAFATILMAKGLTTPEEFASVVEASKPMAQKILDEAIAKAMAELEAKETKA